MSLKSHLEKVEVQYILICMKIGIHERVIDQIKKQFKSNACLKDVHKQAKKSLKNLRDKLNDII